MHEHTQQAGSDLATFDIDPTVFERRWKILAVLCTSLMVVIVGNTALNVALPTLARELNASISQQQWMVDAYGLVFAGLLLTAGTHRRPLRSQGHVAGSGSPSSSSGSVFAAFSAQRRGDHRRACGHGLRRRVRHARHPVDPHQRLPRQRAWQGHRHLGRHLRRRRCGRSGRQRIPARALLVGLGVPGQRADHRRRPGRRLHPAAEVARPASRTRSTRSARCCRSPASARSCTRSSKPRDRGWASAESLLWFGLAAVLHRRSS